MKCPKCKAEHMSVVYGVKEINNIVRRNRKCTICGFKYITQERFVSETRTRKKAGDPE